MGSRRLIGHARSHPVLDLIVVYILQTRSYHRNIAAVRFSRIIHRTKDDIYIIPGKILHIAGGIACVRKRNIPGNVDDNMSRTADIRFQQRAFHCHFNSLKRLVIPLRLTDANVGNTLVLHDSLNIGKIQIDNCGQIDQVRDALNRLLENLVRLLERLRHSSTPVHDLKQLIVGNNDQSVHKLLNAFDAVQRIHHARLGLKAERLRHHANRQYSHLLCKPCNHRSSAGTGTAAHAAGHKHHVRALKRCGKLFSALLSRLLAHLRLCPGAKTLGQLLAYLKKLGGLTELKRLFIRIYTNKIHTVNLFVNHSIYSIITCTANTNHNYLSRRFSVVCLNFKQGFVLLIFIHIYYHIIIFGF